MTDTRLNMMPFSPRALLRAGVLMLTIVIAPLASPVAPAQAQDLSRDVERLKRDLADLQRYIYNGQNGPPPSTSTTESTEAPLSGDVAARLQVKLQELERRLRETNGKTEEVEFKLRQLEQRLDTALADIDFRLTRLEGGNPAAPGQTSALRPGATTGAATGAQPVIPVPGQQNTTVISSAGTEAVPATGQPAAPAGGTLGSLILDAQGNVIGGQPSQSATVGSTPLANPGSAPTAPPPAPATVQPLGPVEGSDIATASEAAGAATLPSEPQALYDYSLGLMRQGDYPGAESALKVFLDQHSQHELVGAALYWLGETYYVRDNYRDAAFAFVDVYSKHPKSSKAPDSLLKLGMSLYALGSKVEACSAFSTLRSEYPNARRAVLKLADDRGAQYGC